jgi:hypothetical protein
MADFIKRLSDSASLTDILIQIEDWLDSLDIYVFKNWFDGQVVDGPIIERHWVSIILKYDYKTMPDPEGAIRMLKYGALVKYRKSKEEDTENHKEQDINQLNNQLQNGQADIQTGDITSSKPQLKDVWLVEIKIPRHFIDELEELEGIDTDDVDPEHISSAQDSDLQAKDAYKAQPNDSDTQDESADKTNQNTNDEAEL